MMDPGESSRVLSLNQQSYSHGAGSIATAVDGGLPMSGHFVKLISNTNGRAEHAGVDAGYCEAGFLLCARKSSVHHVPFDRACC